MTRGLMILLRVLLGVGGVLLVSVGTYAFLYDAGLGVGYQEEARVLGLVVLAFLFISLKMNKELFPLVVTVLAIDRSPVLFWVFSVVLGVMLWAKAQDLLSVPDKRPVDLPRT